MKIEFLKQNGTDTLKLFFLGYGQDATPFEVTKECTKDDYAIVYDYESLDFDCEKLKNYKAIELVAWSMGVMIAPKVLNKASLLSKVTKATAINGTIAGIDDNYGIPMVLWQATIDALNEDTYAKFIRRMCLNASLYQEYVNTKPKRSIDSLKAELNYIKELAIIPSVENFNYDLAIVGNKDKIITPKNQLSAWDKTDTSVVCEDIAHYSLDIIKKVLES